MLYRPLLLTIVTVALALLLVGLWSGVVGPMMATTDPAAATVPGHPDRALRAFTRGVLMLALVLVALLLIVGLVATAREWTRIRRPPRPKVRTKFVDAWKIAGERMKAEEDEER